MSIYRCPICRQSIDPNPRYPSYICSECCQRTKSIDGQPLIYTNAGFSGGIVAQYAGTNRQYDNQFCYIDNIKCEAEEARFGGIVIQIKWLFINRGLELKSYIQSKISKSTTMSSRKPLQSQIIHSWLQCIEENYCSHRINSERSLQAALWSKLNLVLPNRNRRIFIEPRLRTNIDSNCRFPDLVICNTRQAIAFIEIKYLPRQQPSWKKDLSTLQWVHSNQTNLSLVNNRYEGKLKNIKKYSVASNALFIWAGIHRQTDIVLSQHIAQSLRPSFLAIHTETSSAAEPTTRFVAR